MALNLDSRISASEVVSGDDSGMSAANLHWDDTVTYTLDLNASLLFNFRSTNPIALSVDGADVLSTVDVTPHPKYLVVRLTSRADWQSAKATLFFEQVPLNQNQVPAVGGLDPTIINKGKSI